MDRDTDFFCKKWLHLKAGRYQPFQGTDSRSRVKWESLKKLWKTKKKKKSQTQTKGHKHLESQPDTCIREE
jgi:hypothetical protein